MAYPGNMIAELSRISIEEMYNEDECEALEALLAEEESGFYPTPDEEEEVRLFAGYGVDNAALCIEEGPDTTEGGQVIPEWAFN